jgi:hypothetical protein
MVPNKIIFLDSFQITPGNQGKIDRAIVKRKTLIELKKDEIHN